MRGLTIRLILSYIALAVLTLAGAGLLSYKTLAAVISSVDQNVAAARVLAAAQYVNVLQAHHVTWDLQHYADEVMHVYPDVRARVVTPTDPGTHVGTLVSGGTTYGDRSNPRASVKLSATWVTIYDIRQRGAPLDNLVHMPERGMLSLEYAYPETARAAALRRALLGAAAIALLAAVFLALWLGRTLVAPLQRMATAAGRVAEGEWEMKLPTGGPVEIQRLSAAFQTMASRLQGDFQRLRGEREQLQRLAAEIAHEIKTPIASLRTYHELLLDGEHEHRSTRLELLTRGAAQVERLQYLADFLVDMARLEAGTTRLDLEELDLVELAQQAVAAMQPAAQQRRVRLELARPGEAVPILGSPHRIGQALDNLLQNALRYAPPESAVTVEVGATAQGATITVRDQGPGIAPDLLPHIYAPFVRGEGSPGLGLGLAIVRAIAQSHGGGIQAENRAGGGAAFTLVLPLFAGVRVA